MSGDLTTGGAVLNTWVPISGCQSGPGVPMNMIIPVSEPVPIGGVNVLGPFSQIPDPASPIALMINGRAFYATDPSPAFTVSGSSIAWVSTAFSVTPYDTVVGVYYTYLEG
jgi:hypothetical protein